ncbi:hypothetical protein EB1_03300 [Empedobacter brevis NBRC 14943 = ATCC 43319]|uniref:Uncharacterized protein n=1 Tax=Empedobacter brevis NBRC 14943 = ATCC 43319 TaxID=1218108 RepID=A0A511NCJ5_9FLAO|nr:hypothetical protein [Empedobacter brevis]GEM50540.1 hypothetical protein EB1_03300 [Empedobacter brevis NBRC 14943 = ATCC 43319]
MKKFALMGFLVISCAVYSQTPKTDIKTEKENTEPYFDYYRDFQNYATNKSSRYRELYDKYTVVDSVSVYHKMLRKPEEYPSPCYEVAGDGTARMGMAYHYTFLLQLFYKRLSCLKDGSKLDPDFMKYEAYDAFRNETTREAIELLELYEKKRIGDDELDALFERAKTYFKDGFYTHSNALFSFLATVDESYREAAINNVGLSFYHKKAYKKALNYFEYAITLYPESYLGYLNAGAAKSHLPVDLGDENQSIYYFKKAYELAPDNPNVINNYKNALKGRLTP